MNLLKINCELSGEDFYQAQTVLKGLTLKQIQKSLEWGGWKMTFHNWE